MRSSILTLVLAATFCAAQQPCEKLADLKLPQTAITSAESVTTAPAHCVVKGITRPSRDSEIRFEVWLPPAADWNGRYEQAGNGGWAGSIQPAPLTAAVKRGYAAAGTDDGHQSGQLGGASWAIGHPEKLIDFGYRAVHETSVQAKAIVRAFYGKEAAHNYFFGCSDGGREALMEAERFPDDFDGIIAGAPANDWSHHFAGFIWNEQALLNDPASTIPASKLPAIQKAALDSCDALDGVKDNLIEDPRVCHFDPAVLACKGGDSPDCLTAPQVIALKKIYTGPKHPRTGKQIYPGYPPGAEATPGGWAPWIIGTPPDRAIQFMFGNTYFGQAVAEDPNWDFRKMNFDSDVDFADQKAGVIINSNSPDLRSFRARGGKLIQYHGWGDAAISPLGSIDYYEKVRAFLAKYPNPRVASAGPIDEFYRLFMVPGMGHCAGGHGPNSFGNGGAPGADADHDVVMALERWVEKGIAPTKIIGTGGTVVGDPSKNMTRPLCPYPQIAKYKGTGDSNDAGSFSCVAP